MVPRASRDGIGEATFTSVEVMQDAELLADPIRRVSSQIFQVDATQSGQESVLLGSADVYDVVCGETESSGTQRRTEVIGLNHAIEAKLTDVLEVSPAPA